MMRMTGTILPRTGLTGQSVVGSSRSCSNLVGVLDVEDVCKHSYTHPLYYGIGPRTKKVLELEMNITIPLGARLDDSSAAQYSLMSASVNASARLSSSDRGNCACTRACSRTTFSDFDDGAIGCNWGEAVPSSLISSSSPVTEPEAEVEAESDGDLEEIVGFLESCGRW